MLVKEWTLESSDFGRPNWSLEDIKEIKLVLLYFSYKFFPFNFDFQSQNVMSIFSKKCIAPVCECVCFSFLLFFIFDVASLMSIPRNFYH